MEAMRIYRWRTRVRHFVRLDVFLPEASKKVEVLQK